MNNKRGSFGGKLLLVLILMLASAVGGAYGYSVLDGKMAAKDAEKELKAVSVSDYDDTDAKTIQGYIDQAQKDLETAKSRKEVYGILDDFKTDVSKVKTRTEKELEEARKAVEEARNSANNASSTNTDESTITDPSDGSTGVTGGDNSNSSGDDSSTGSWKNLFGMGDDESDETGA